MTERRAELYKNGMAVFVKGSHGQVAEIEILADGGPLCVAPVWDWSKEAKVPGLYLIYFKRLGLRFGPYYAGIALAAKDMKKALKAFPEAGFWEQSLKWYGRQGAFHRWIEKNMGRPDDLIGGRWEREEECERG